jgi:proline racemase
MKRFSTIDAHVAGETVRLLVEGAPEVAGRSMADKRARMMKHAAPLRRALMLEPRGHSGMQGAMLTAPVSATAHAGLLFMNAGGFPLVSGEGVIAAVTIAIEEGIIHADAEELSIDTPAGVLIARPHRTAVRGKARVESVAVTGLQGYVQSAALPVLFGGRTVPVDVAFGGELYAIVDGEAVGTAVDSEHAPELLRAGTRLKQAVEAALHVSHPTAGTIHGVIFTAPARGGGDLRTATVLEGGVLRRSPGVTGTVALMAVLDAMGVLEDQTVTHEGLIGTSLPSSVLHRHTVSGVPTVVPVVQGSAWITGRHAFELDDDDPLPAFEM